MSFKMMKALSQGAPISLTLKKRILMIFTASTLIPFISTAFVSYNAITSIQNTKLQSSIESNLRQVQLSLETTISNLNHVSQQLAYQGSIGKQLEQFLLEREPYGRIWRTEDIKTQLNLITFTNPNIGLTTYYFSQSGATLFENSDVKDTFNLESLPLLARYYTISYYGPHISQDVLSNQYVLSALRKVELPEYDDIYVYVESGFKLTQNILETDRIGKHMGHLILDNDGRISFSEVQDVFPENMRLPEMITDSSGVYNGYYWNKSTSNQGWSIVSLIPAADYNAERNLWLLQMGGLSALFGAVSLGLAWLLWAMVYHPLRKFQAEIKHMTDNSYRPADEKAAARIPEFEHVLRQFRRMKAQIAELFADVERKEKRRADLEIEKLLYQINPHFLMNTLDTAHWLAVMNGQEEIDRLVTSLNKLLYYNLGKLGKISTIGEEIESLRAYLTLQQIRYDFRFDVHIHADEALLDTPVPRFILQPLVENALYHGLKDDGRIEVEVRPDGEMAEIAIRDNGMGIPEAALRRLLEQEEADHEKVGMGIGLNYVKRMLAAHYEGQAVLNLDSMSGQGTTVVLRLPMTGGDRDDESIDCG